MNKTSIGYILSSRPYKETDGLMSVYLEDNSLRSFIYKGVYKPQAKRLGSSQPFVRYQFTYRDREGILSPIDVVRVKSFTKIQEDMHKAMLAQSINSLFIHFHAHLSYSLYDWSLVTMEESDNPILVFVMVLVESLNLMGLQPYVDGDVITRCSKINHFDISKGGFIYRALENDFNRTELRTIRKLFKAKPVNYSIMKDDLIEPKVINAIVDYFEYHTSFVIKGYQLYQSIQ